MALDKLQGEKNCSQGYILPVLFAMKHRIEQQDATNSNIGKDFKTTMLEAIKGRFKNLYTISESNKDLFIAAVVTPCFKTDFIEDDNELVKIKQMLLEECRKIRGNNNDNQNHNSVENLKISADFFLRFGSRRLSRINSVENDIESEVQRFWSDNRENIEILKEFGIVREVYRKFNTTLSSSAAVERVFSQSMLIFTPRRNRISGANFEKTLMLKHNRKILE